MNKEQYRIVLDFETALSMDDKIPKFLFMLLNLAMESKVVDGSFYTSEATLCASTGYSRQEVRTLVRKLIATKVITKECFNTTTKAATKITICGFDSYVVHEDCLKPKKKQSSTRTSKEEKGEEKEKVSLPSPFTPIYSSTKEKEEGKEEKSPIPQTTNVVCATLPAGRTNSQSKLIEEMTAYREKFSREHLNGFYQYWSEEIDGKCRYEHEPTWDILSRLYEWPIKTKTEVTPEDVMRLWNEICGTVLPQIKKIDGSRRKKVLQRLKEMKDISIEELFNKVVSSSFLTGMNNHGWKCDFDWVFTNDKNWQKILEGNYDKNNAENIARYNAEQQLLNDAAMRQLSRDATRALQEQRREVEGVTSSIFGDY